MHDELETVEKKLRDCMKPDQRRLRRRLARLRKQTGETDDKQLAGLKQELDRALLQKEQKAARKPKIEFPPQLPVSEKIHEIHRAVSDHPVTVVCGETGSGKSTQLPKLCVQMGYGLDGLIGHTQPRRIAARSIANRIASETGSRLGEDVGFRIRHTDRTSALTWIKVMTDGVLLSEMQRDRWLNDYEVLIIDEAHERSLNIDFLLGYLKLLIARRPDLKLIITSATIDVERFSEFFNNAPVVEVSGRSYPVDMRYRPIDEDESED
ncbi:MAG: ATP-dependent helicase, partial [Gammaproteobacteria bacterium]|nr:ATP-dependent helicase [Gammaproteobacteria bacterium]